MVSTALRLTVWKPLVFGRRIARDSGAPGGEWPLPQSDELYVEVYRWHLAEAPWESAEPEDAARLREALIDRFNPFRPALERRFDMVTQTLQDFEAVLKTGRSTWRESIQVIAAATEDDEDQQFRLDSVRTFFINLKWINQVFHTVPQANVTVR